MQLNEFVCCLHTRCKREFLGFLILTNWGQIQTKCAFFLLPRQSWLLLFNVMLTFQPLLPTPKPPSKEKKTHIYFSCVFERLCVLLLICDENSMCKWFDSWENSWKLRRATISTHCNASSQLNGERIQRNCSSL